MIYFSVVIPIYNSTSTVLDSIWSVLNQDYKNFEIIVVDDGSTDDAENLIKMAFGFDCVRYFKKSNGGVSSARNLGFHSARGEYVIFLDSDDLLSDNFLRCAARRIRESVNMTECQIFVTPYYYFTELDKYKKAVDRKKWIYYPPLIFGRNFNQILIGMGNCFPISSCVIPRQVVLDVGGFDEGLRSMEDWDFWWKIVSNGIVFNYNVKANDGFTSIRVQDGLMSNCRQMIDFQKFLYKKHNIVWMDSIVRNNVLRRMINIFRALLYVVFIRIQGLKINLNGC